MQIIITGQQINLGDNLRSYAEKALDAAVSKYFADAISADVRVIKEGEEIKTDITVHPISGALVKVTGYSADAYASFDGAVAKLSRQLSRYKNRLTDHRAEPVEMVDMAVIDAKEDEEEVGDAPVIIAEMQTELPICTVSGAVMRMDLAGLPALMFKNSAHGGLNMVYRRVDGNIGWIDPKNK